MEGQGTYHREEEGMGKGGRGGIPFGDQGKKETLDFCQNIGKRAPEEKRQKLQICPLYILSQNQVDRTIVQCTHSCQDDSLNDFCPAMRL